MINIPYCSEARIDGSTNRRRSETVRPGVPVGWWDAIVAWFLTVPAQHIHRMPEGHWIKHRQMVAFAILVAIPLSGLSWAHLIALLVGVDRLPRLAFGALAVLMMGTMALLDSMLCGALAMRTTTAPMVAVLLFRWMFAVCSAASVSSGTLLLIMGDQLPHEEAILSLAEKHQLADAEQARSGVRNLEHATAILEEKRSALRWQLDIPPTNVLALRRSHDSCQATLRALEHEYQVRALALESTRLEMDGSDIPRLDEELVHLRHRISLTESECRGLQATADREFGEFRGRIEADLTAATEQELAARRNSEAARLQVTKNVSEITPGIDQAWSRSLSADVKAALNILAHEWWARITGCVVFILVLFVELSPMLGKIALRGGPLDQLGAIEDDLARRAFESQHLDAVLHENAYHSVAHETARLKLEIAAAREAAEAVYDEAEALRKRVQEVRDSAGASHVPEAVFKGAVAGMISVFDRYMRGECHRPDATGLG